MRHAALLLATLIIGGFLGSLLLRYGPGFDVDERDIDLRYSSSTLDALHRARAGEHNVFWFYIRYLGGISHGDLGVSRSLNRPVSELIRARAAVTLRLIGWGMCGGWLLGLSFAVAAVLRPNNALLLVSDLLSGLFLCLPPAVLALLVFLANGPVPIVIALTLFPLVYRYARTLLSGSLKLPHVLAAAARGIAPARVFFRHVVPPVIGPLTAFFAVCVTISFAAAVPVEVICDLPGAGQLAWKAAMSRDLPLLVGMTLAVTSTTLIVNAAAELVGNRR